VKASTFLSQTRIDELSHQICLRYVRRHERTRRVQNYPLGALVPPLGVHNLIFSSLSHSLSKISSRFVRNIKLTKQKETERYRDRKDIQTDRQTDRKREKEKEREKEHSRRNDALLRFRHVTDLRRRFWRQLSLVTFSLTVSLYCREFAEAPLT